MQCTILHNAMHNAKGRPSMRRNVEGALVVIGLVEVVVPRRLVVLDVRVRSSTRSAGGFSRVVATVVVFVVV